METKKVQALNDDLLENIIGGISLRRMSGITNRVLRPVPDAEARRPIRGRLNM